MENTYPEHPRKDSNKVYFLVLVIAALLGTNAYLFLEDKKASDRIVTLTDEKSRMETEIDKIETELDQVTQANVKLTGEMEENQELARKKIDELRRQLRRGELTQGELAKAQKEIKELRYFVSKYSSDIAELKKENSSLTVERDSLKSTIQNVSERASQLEQQNTELSSKVKVAAALKTSTLEATPLRVRNNGRESETNRAGSVKKLKISFSIADNSIAAKGMHEVFIRIIDPNGNLIIPDSGNLFTADGDDLQYTYKTSIEFDNVPGKVYNVDWTSPEPFHKGAYTIVLYSGGYTMGRASLSLR